MRAGWVPNQHGAWAMLMLPFALGVMMAVRDQVAGWHLLPLFGCWMLGYFSFHATSLWLKAAPRRKPGYVPPMVTYTVAAALLGGVTLMLGGITLAWWVLPYLALLLPALWLAAQRRERATIGGALTVAAASGMTLVVRFPDPSRLALDQAGVPALVTIFVFAYFFGTVLYVKTNIRERGSRAYLVASVAWHATWTLAGAALALAGPLPWWWTVFFAATTVRALVVPGRGWTPMRLGLVEVAFSTALVVGFIVWP